MKHSTLGRIAWIAFCPAIGALCAAKTADQLPRPSSRPIVVELFTSQGCSSCPPADRLLGELAAHADILALGYHVDYWDELGWRDRFSMTEATQRQHRYVEALHLSSAFTPQVVVDGRESFVGSDRPRIAAALSRPAVNVPIDIKVDRGELVISLPDSDALRTHEVNLAAYIPSAVTAVGRGENSGKTLTEFNIVRQFRRLGEWRGTRGTFRVPLDTLPADAVRVAVLLQQVDGGAISGAASASIR